MPPFSFSVGERKIMNHFVACGEGLFSFGSGFAALGLHANPTDCLVLVETLGYTSPQARLNAITNVAYLVVALRRSATLHGTFGTGAVGP
jgi:hypothetical protein